MPAPNPRASRNPPDVIPVFPLAGVILLPRGQLPLNVFEPRYLAMVDDTLASHRLIGIIQPSSQEIPGIRPHLYKVGGLGRITSFAETEDGRYLITLTGITRFMIEEEVEVDSPYRQVRANYAPFAQDRSMPSEEGLIDRDALLDALKRYFILNRIESDWEAIERAPSEALVNSLSMIAPVETAEKQALLEAPTVMDRAKSLIALIELALANAPGSGAHRLN